MDENGELSSDCLYRESVAAARNHVDKFFAGRMFHCGGNIPRRMLHCPFRLDGVVNESICTAVDRAYACMGGRRRSKSGETDWDIRMVNETLKILSKSGIPQPFAGGMLLMYLEFVEGIDIKWDRKTRPI